MFELHPEILKKNGKNEFVILSYEEFLLVQQRLADAEDLIDLREAVRGEGSAPTVTLEQLKANLPAD